MRLVWLPKWGKVELRVDVDTTELEPEGKRDVDAFYSLGVIMLGPPDEAER